MTKDELIEKTNKAITELVYAKYDLQKAYNYYNGVRDADQFRYLEEVYGANVPTTLRFTPLIKKHVDALIGEYLEMPIIPKIQCKDEDTISHIYRDKQLEIARQSRQFLLQKMKNSLVSQAAGKQQNDGLVEQQLKQLIEDLNKNFTDFKVDKLGAWTVISAKKLKQYVQMMKLYKLDYLIKM